MSGLLYAATLAAALGSGLAAGVFFAFSTFVMPALARLAPAEGIAAMQSINRAAITPAFMTALFGTALACIGLAAWAALERGEPAAPWVLAGSGLYVIGAIVVTIAGNVPLNESLASVDPHGPDGASRWSAYVTRWTAWNHVRGAAALGAAAMFTVALAAA